ncbi:MAG: M3 family oligoendopeptidase [Lachnospiraceae bacterium]|nr:M3 family oligoendopeptidase [Lachnospiraceae bacterium]
MKFSEMPYERIEAEDIISKSKSFIERFKTAGDFEGACRVFEEYDVFQRHIYTTTALAYIRHGINTNDEYYDAEVDYWNETAPVAAEYETLWKEALLESPFKKELSEKYGEIIFINAELEKKAFSPEIISDMQKEAKLVSKYEKLIASAQIPFEGEVYTLSQLTPFKTSEDDKIRHDAWMTEGKWYKDNKDELDSIYDELTHLRDKMGNTLGFGGYTGLGYCRMLRNWFNKEDVEKFRANVREYLVPVADKLRKAQAKRLGFEYPLSYSDMALEFRSGNPRPSGSADDILDAGQKFYDELSPETSKFFRMMRENELMDVLSKKGKEGGGYQEGLYEYKVPFIFANFNGTQGDVEVVTHEAGHAFEDYLNEDRVPCSTICPTLDGAEIHSMSMEFFAWPWAKEFFGDDTDKYLYSHLASALLFIPYGTMVDHFQHIVYEKPDMTPAERDNEWRKLTGIYMPWVKLDGEIPFYSEGCAWQRQSHIYSNPFYYIDYCLAQTVSLEFWAMIREDKDKAWKKYMEYTTQGGSDTVLNMLNKAGLASPMDPENFKNVCKKADEFLSSFDLSGIE